MQRDSLTHFMLRNVVVFMLRYVLRAPQRFLGLRYAGGLTLR